MSRSLPEQNVTIFNGKLFDFFYQDQKILTVTQRIGIWHFDNDATYRDLTWDFDNNAIYGNLTWDFDNDPTYRDLTYSFGNSAI